MRIDFLVGRKHSWKDRQVKVSFSELKAQIYWPTTDQKVRGSNPCGRTKSLQSKVSHVKYLGRIYIIHFYCC